MMKGGNGIHKVANQVIFAPAPPAEIAAPSAVDPVSYFHRVWPPTLIAFGVVATGAWISLLSYGLFELGELVF
jgi:hypothetical protein